MLSSPLTGRAVKTDPAVLHFVTEAEQNGPTPEKLAAEKIKYQQQRLLECFNFQQLRRGIGRMTGLLRNNAGAIQLSATGDIVDIGQQTETSICIVGENFQRQLQSLFVNKGEPVTDPVILDRLTKWPRNSVTNW